MRLETFLVLFLVPLCLGQNETNAQRSTRTPQGHLQYSDPNGQRVSWKLYSPYNQWRSHLENPQPSESRTEQAETEPQAKSAKPQEAAEPTVEKQQQPQTGQAVEYKPYSMVPTYIKQLILRMYEPQGPYVDPQVYIYHTPVESKPKDQFRSAAEQPQSDQQEQKADRRQESVATQQEAVEQTQQKSSAYQQAFEQEAPSYQQSAQQKTAPLQQQTQEEDSDRYYEANEYIISGYHNPLVLKRKAQFAYATYPLREVGNIEYKKENSESKPAQYGFVPSPQQQTAPQPVQPAAEPAQQTQEKVMPSLLQKLLHLQAQTPYYVIANRIAYKPKKLFIPKPIAEDDTGSYTYRSKVYYLRDDEADQEDKSSDKSAKDGRH